MITNPPDPRHTTRVRTPDVATAANIDAMRRSERIREAIASGGWHQITPDPHGSPGAIVRIGTHRA